MPDIKLTEAEKTAIIASMQASFGECTCMIMAGRPSMCEGHRFLHETDGRLDLQRIERLLFVRRTQQRWVNAEWIGHCPECQRDGVLISQTMKMCFRCADTLPVPHFERGALPW